MLHYVEIFGLKNFSAKQYVLGTNDTHVFGKYQRCNAFSIVFIKTTTVINDKNKNVIDYEAEVSKYEI